MGLSELELFSETVKICTHLGVMIGNIKQLCCSGWYEYL